MASEKTEQPTPRRLRKAREEGDVPVSRVLAQAVGFVAALAVLPAGSVAAARTCGELMVRAIEGQRIEALELAKSVLVLSLPVIGVAAFAAAATTFATSGGLIALGRVQPKLSRLDFFQGLRGLFEPTRLFGVLRALLGAAVVVILAYATLVSALPGLVNTSGEVSAGIALAGESARSLLWWVAALGLALGLIDLLMVRRAWLKRWMMTRDEVKREFKESEGDPELRAARRRAHQEALVGNTLYAVKDASVVIVNPTHLAAALRYDENEDAAPRLVAEGRGDLARRIVEAAHHYGVPVIRDVPVARALVELEVGEEIPEALYEAVAEILREVWDLEQRS